MNPDIKYKEYPEIPRGLKNKGGRKKPWALEIKRTRNEGSLFDFFPNWYADWTSFGRFEKEESAIQSMEANKRGFWGRECDFRVVFKG